MDVLSWEHIDNNTIELMIKDGCVVTGTHKQQHNRINDQRWMYCHGNT